jgi:hypothetical protein
MRKKWFLLFIVFLFVLCLFPFSYETASADTGPKRSVRIDFENLGDEPCYGTLLAPYDGSGPWRAWDGTEQGAYYKDEESGRWGELDYEIWKAFVDYEDEGFYFWQRAFEVSKTKCISWSYYPPYAFKVLLYFPNQNLFISSDEYERYAFHSYYSVDMANITFSENGTSEKPLLLESKLVAENSYNYGEEILGLVIRILITLAIETGIALLLNIREKKPLLFITIINVLTQIVLNVILFFYNYQHGLYVPCYILLELLVLAIEAVAYCLFLPKLSSKEYTKKKCVGYSATSNALSFVGGLIIALIFPQFF